MQDHYKSAQIHTYIGIKNQFYLVSYSVTCVAGSLRHNHYHNIIVTTKLLLLLITIRCNGNGS